MFYRYGIVDFDTVAKMSVTIYVTSFQSYSLHLISLKSVLILFSKCFFSHEVYEPNFFMHFL
jgi:hypothetical protein